jgi:hypothetical protein
MHITTGITLNPSKDRKEAAGQNMKWNGKLSEPPSAPLREDIQKLELEASLTLRRFEEGRRNKPSVQARCPEYQKLRKTSWSNWTSRRAEIGESIRLSRTI